MDPVSYRKMSKGQLILLIAQMKSHERALAGHIRQLTDEMKRMDNEIHALQKAPKIAQVTARVGYYTSLLWCQIGMHDDAGQATCRRCGVLRDRE